MKRYIKYRDDAVSPVIATILMVAITVVLVVAMYSLMTDIEDTGDPLLIGTLSYRMHDSTPENGMALFGLAISRPSEPLETNVNVFVMDNEGMLVDKSNFNHTWIYIAGDQDTGRLKGGDRLIIEVNNDDGDPINISGYEVIISIKGYTGSINGMIPR